MKSLEILTLLYFERASIPRGVALKEVGYSGVSVLDMLNFGNVRLIHSLQVFLGMPRPTRPSTMSLVIAVMLLVLLCT